ncbi:MAG: hypothetical protein ABSC50_02640 [Candidatus Bathyarchaeia archaeon]
MTDFPNLKDEIEKAIKENNAEISRRLIDMYDKLDKRISEIERRLGIA